MAPHDKNHTAWTAKTFEIKIVDPEKTNHNSINHDSPPQETEYTSKPPPDTGASRPEPEILPGGVIVLPQPEKNHDEGKFLGRSTSAPPPASSVSQKHDETVNAGNVIRLPGFEFDNNNSTSGRVSALPGYPNDPATGRESDLNFDVPRVAAADHEPANDEPILQAITTVVGFPQSKTYNLGEPFNVTLAVSKGSDPTVALARTKALLYASNSTSVQQAEILPTRQVKAVALYEGKLLDSGQSAVQPLYSTHASLWSWEVTPTSSGRHYIKIILSSQLVNNEPDLTAPFIYEIDVTESWYSHAKRILTQWLTPQWIPVDWIWKSIMLPVGALVLWQVRVLWRRHRMKKKRALQQAGKMPQEGE